MPKLSGPQKLVLLGSATAVALATVVPRFAPAAWGYDPMVAVTLVMVIAVVATAGFAADNLREFRKATEAEYTPVLDIRVVERSERGVSRLGVELRNIGRGIAAGVEAVVWWLDSDLVQWLPHPLKNARDLLRPGEETSDEVKHPFFQAAAQKHFRPDLPDVVIEVRYRDALKRDQELFVPYAFGRDESGERRFLPSSQAIPEELKSLQGKRDLIEAALTRFRATNDLGLYGIGVVGRVSPRTVQVAIQKDGKDLWMAQGSIERPVYHLEEELERALPEVIAFLQEGEAGHQIENGGRQPLDA